MVAHAFQLFFWGVLVLSFGECGACDITVCGAMCVLCLYVSVSHYVFVLCAEHVP